LPPSSWPAANGKSPSELVFNHHAIGIVTAIGLAALGAMIAARQPRNPIGWLMSLAALLLGVFSFTQQYAPLAMAESLPGADLASWLATWTNLPGIAITITFVFLLPPGVERQQIKWFAYGAMVGIPLGLPAEVPFWGRSWSCCSRR
jgi:FtsH-binding integral membrane protein